MPAGGRIEGLCAVAAVQLLTGAVVLAAGRSRRLPGSMPVVISVAAGLLLATGVADLLPEAVEALGAQSAMWIVLLGTIVVLFLLERLTGLSGAEETGNTPQVAEHVGHHHHHGSAAGLLLGSAMHSAVDGTALAAAFAVSARTGWITAVAIALHETPHRLGDFGLLVHLGVPRVRAMVLSIAAGASALLGWTAVAILGQSGHQAWLLPVSAGSFLFIALADLVPELREEHRPRAVLLQAAGFCAGVLLTLLLLRLPGV